MQGAVGTQHQADIKAALDIVDKITLDTAPIPNIDAHFAEDPDCYEVPRSRAKEKIRAAKHLYGLQAALNKFIFDLKNLPLEGTTKQTLLGKLRQAIQESPLYQNENSFFSSWFDRQIQDLNYVISHPKRPQEQIGRVGREKQLGFKIQKFLVSSERNNNDPYYALPTFWELSIMTSAYLPSVASIIYYAATPAVPLLSSTSIVLHITAASFIMGLIGYIIIPLAINLCLVFFILKLGNRSGAHMVGALNLGVGIALILLGLSNPITWFCMLTAMTISIMIFLYSYNNYKDEKNKSPNKDWEKITIFVCALLPIVYFCIKITSIIALTLSVASGIALFSPLGLAFFNFVFIMILLKITQKTKTAWTLATINTLILTLLLVAGVTASLSYPVIVLLVVVAIIVAAIIIYTMLEKFPESNERSAKKQAAPAAAPPGYIAVAAHGSLHDATKSNDGVSVISEEKTAITRSEQKAKYSQHQHPMSV